MTQKTSSGWGEAIRTIIYAVLVALVVRTFAYEPFNIPSGSMFPTLLVGDYLFVSKFSYGYSRYSLPWSLPLFQGRIFNSPTDQGDVSVFKLPSDNKTDYIKRVIGLPGDRIQVRQGRLYINDELVPREKVGSRTAPGYGGIPNQVDEYIETLPNGRKHLIWETSDNEALDNTPVYHVPQGHYFMMGDNRDRSQDSRVLGQVGYVPEENLIGRAEFIFFSYDGAAPLWEIWRWPGSVRFGRIFDSVE